VEPQLIPDGELVTVPLPVLLTLRILAEEDDINATDTDLFDDIATVH
jgi:hypothetical protein